MTFKLSSVNILIITAVKYNSVIYKIFMNFLLEGKAFKYLSKNSFNALLMDCYCNYSSKQSLYGK